VSHLLGVDIGGAGLRLQTVRNGTASPVATAPGVRITPEGIDLDALVGSVQALLAAEAPSPGERNRIDVLVWSMRGLLGLSDPQSVLGALAARLGANRTVVCSDALSSLVGALGQVRPGAVVAAGTGAVAFGTDFGEVWHRVDGWGHVLGDRGSGAWIGLEGLRAALRAHDGVSRTGAGLLDAAAEHFGPPAAWPRLVMTRADAPAQLAGFAPVVTALAVSDPAAAKIVAAAGSALAESLAAATRGVTTAAVTATGGLLQAPAVRRAFDIACLERELVPLPPLGTSLDGALELARHVHSDRALVSQPPYLLLG
jgi:N-acetylglucosamine kinase-like BadF-type ATPase